MNLTLDFETRSECDLKKCGMYVYAEHPSTEVICLAVKVDDNEPRIWIAPEFHYAKAGLTETRLSTQTLKALLENADKIYAHNAAFELALWRVMEDKWHIPQPPIEKWYCTAALAASYALPRDLAGAGRALGLPVQKDNKGHTLMLKMCKPRKETKHNKNKWHETPQQVVALAKYCMQDVEAEHLLQKSLKAPLSVERKMWLLDYKINTLGVYCQVNTVKKIVERIDKYKKSLLKEMWQATDGIVDSPTKVALTLEWLKSQGVLMPDLTKGSVKVVLESPVEAAPPAARRVLEIRQALGKSSTAKLQAMIHRTCKDGRIRGSLLFHGASTGRWAGRGIQPQNMPRGGGESPDELISLREKLLALSPEEFKKQTRRDVMDVASVLTRSMLTAPDGRELLCADFAAIEARVLAWLAEEKRVLTGFRKGHDPYKTAAAEIFQVSYSKVTKAQRLIGKVAVLALGYQGAVGAFTKMAVNYGIEALEEKKVKEIVKAWRDAHGHITRFWYGLEKAAMQAIENPDKAYRCEKILVSMNGKFLQIRLPSGRLLSYLDPNIEPVAMPWVTYRCIKPGCYKDFDWEVGDEVDYIEVPPEELFVEDHLNYRDNITYWGVDSFTKKFCKLRTYGGKLVENVTQGVARDLLRDALLRTDMHPGKIVMHVHDEIVIELEKRGACDAVLENFCDFIASLPAWAKGLPVKATGWRGKEYRKE